MDLIAASHRRTSWQLARCCSKEDTPALAAPYESAKQGVSLRREDYYSTSTLCNQKALKSRIFVGEIDAGAFAQIEVLLNLLTTTIESD
jgi:hypothetical protein